MISAPNVNGQGQIAFYSNLNHSSAVWFGKPGALNSVGSGDAAPGAGAGVKFSNTEFNFSPPPINERGQIVFQSRLSNFVNSLWVADAIQKQLIVADDSPVPGYPKGATFFVFQSAQLNLLGKVAFAARIIGAGTDGIEYALFSGYSRSTLSLIVRKRQQVPRMPAGVVFGDVDDYSINDKGAVAFSAKISGPGIIAGQNDFGIWAANAEGEIFPAVRLGDQLETTAGIFRTVAALKWAAADATFDSAELFTPWNARGELVFQAGFGAFAAGNYLITVPEPAAATLAAAAALALAAFGWRKRQALRRKGRQERRAGGNADSVLPPAGAG